MPIVIWDNGNNQTSGGECHAWIRRAVNPKLRSQATSVVYPQVLDALWEGKNSAAWGSALTEVRAEADESILWANADGLTSQKEWDSSYIQLEAKMEWFADGARIGIRYSGAGTPKIVLDSAEKSVWWILVDAAEIQKNDTFWGTELGNLFFLFHWNIRFGTPFLILYGLFSGIFLGGWIMALAEMADIFPIFARRSRFQRGLSFTILCIAAGKTVGALIYYYNGWLP